MTAINSLLRTATRDVERDATKTDRWAITLSALVASVWLIHGLLNKLLNFTPRHLQIVQAMPLLHGAHGVLAVKAIGIAETLMGGWILLGQRPRLAAVVQTVVLLTMNVLELTFARRLLLWPVGLIPLNLLFLSVAWVGAELRSGEPFYWLRRHPFAVDAFFDHSLVLTYAFPRAVLEALLPPGLTLETYRGYGFVAIAMVQARGLRPSGLPGCAGRDFVLSGYRIFTTMKKNGVSRRGLCILRSDVDSRLMAFFGNLLTHYHYRRCSADFSRSADHLAITIRTSDRSADVRVTADLKVATQQLPTGSVFETLHDARRFAGPLPLTFDYEASTDSIVVIKGQRQAWEPKLVPVEVSEVGFFDQPCFAGVRGTLASAFYVHDIPYRWRRGVRVPLESKAT